MSMKSVQLSIAASLLLPLSLLANGGVWGSTSHGLVFRKETRVAMAKERLFISLKKIRVEYEFRNDSDQDVTTDILFPLGDYGYVAEGDEQMADEVPVGTHFKLWCDGKPKSNTLVLKAILPKDGVEDIPAGSDPFMNWGGKDVTAVVKRYGLLDRDFGKSRIAKLSQRQRDALEELGLVVFKDNDSDEPQTSMGITSGEDLKRAEGLRVQRSFDPRWRIYECHQWEQTFPAKRRVSIALEYEPIPQHEGIRYSIDDPRLCEERPDMNHDMPNLEGTNHDLHEEIMSQAKRLGRRLHAREDHDSDMIDHRWITYVLTTARTWKGPIEDFELRVEGGPRTPLSFKWPRPIERLGPNSYRVCIKNFRPRRNIRVDFFPL